MNERGIIMLTLGLFLLLLVLALLAAGPFLTACLMGAIMWIFDLGHKPTAQFKAR